LLHVHRVNSGLVLLALAAPTSRGVIVVAARTHPITSAEVCRYVPASHAAAHAPTHSTHLPHATHTHTHAHAILATHPAHPAHPAHPTHAHPLLAHLLLLLDRRILLVLALLAFKA
jgi:hypothetical protein